MRRRKKAGAWTTLSTFAGLIILLVATSLMGLAAALRNRDRAEDQGR
ncbi:hypothetical protein [Microbacterium sp. BWR-S6Y]